MTKDTKENKLRVRISVNGQIIEEEYPEHQKIEVAIHKALRDTKNKDDLSLYDVTLNGKPVDVTKTWKESGIPAGSTIIVSNKPGKKA